MNSFILTLFHEGDKLKATSLFHLLKGKRSASILLFGFFHEILRFSGIFPKLKEENFLAQLRRLSAKGWLREDAGEFEITAFGVQASQQFLSNYSFDNIDFFRFGRSDMETWRLVKFAVQVVSNLAANENNYIPIESEVFFLKRIKHWLAARPREATIGGIYQELQQLFDQMNQQEANLLANQFSGYQFEGLVNFQLLKVEEKTLAFLLEREAVHGFFVQLAQQPDFILHDLTADLLKKNQNQSMLTTRNMVLEGYDKEKIQQLRRLKQGTIHDHLLEWAIQDNSFPFEKFISQATVQRLEKLTLPAKDWVYQTLFQEAPLDYFEFRLVQIQQFRKYSQGVG